MQDSVPSFARTLANHDLILRRQSVETLQVNIGKLCNQACLHCHVEAGPKRTEIMTRETMDRLLELLTEEPSIRLVDITGGAPEMNPEFKPFVTEIRRRGIEVLDRCNLTVLEEPEQEGTAEFLREHRVQVVASLPCYSETNVDQQRGNGVFAKSIRALKKLNALGYARSGGPNLDLVYNPVGAFLPPEQQTLEATYKTKLREDFGIEFSRLYTITNMPIKRFLRDLERQKKLDSYMQLLLDEFNPQAVEGVMCRSLLSIGWDGKIYDCDFNQMLEISVEQASKDIWSVSRLSELKNGSIALGNHCYGCTAGAGSSCSGTVTSGRKSNET